MPLFQFNGHDQLVIKNMKYSNMNTQMVQVDRINLDQSNPRHDKYVDQEEVISYLCINEQVLSLARDIATYGLNPLELFALIPEGEGSFIAVEGNRRLCAIKLLNNPDLAPADQRREFRKAAENWEPMGMITAIEFEKRADVEVWLDRFHAGADEGRGRRPWNADQKARNSGYSKNNFALALLDFGQQRNLISAKDRKNRISTVQRYLANPKMRNTMGLDPNYIKPLKSSLDENNFLTMLQFFLEAVAEKKINTRDNKTKILDFSHKLSMLDIFKKAETDLTDFDKNSNKDLIKKPNKPAKPVKPTTIATSNSLQDALKDMPSYKLERLYFSLCSLNLDNHTPIISIGAWSFLETLTSICGRKPTIDFHSYLSPQKIQSLGVEDDVKSVRDAIRRIADLGNATKHNKIAAAFNGEQMYNDFQTMENMLVFLAKEGKGRT
jgi:hypothetical protein